MNNTDWYEKIEKINTNTTCIEIMRNIDRKDYP